MGVELKSRFRIRFRVVLVVLTRRTRIDRSKRFVFAMKNEK